MVCPALKCPAVVVSVREPQVPEHARGEGVFCVQLHAGPPMEIRFRNMSLVDQTGVDADARRWRSLALDAIVAGAADVASTDAAVMRWEQRVCAVEARVTGMVEPLARHRTEAARVEAFAAATTRRRGALWDAAERAGGVVRCVLYTGPHMTPFAW